MQQGCAGHQPDVCTQNGRLATTGGGPKQPSEIAVLDITSGKWESLRKSLNLEVSPESEAGSAACLWMLVVDRASRRSRLSHLRPKALQGGRSARARSAALLEQISIAGPLSTNVPSRMLLTGRGAAVAAQSASAAPPSL